MLKLIHRKIEASHETLITALRVLSAICHQRVTPDPLDLEALRHIAPEFASLPPDELACKIIWQAVDARGETSRVIGHIE